MMAMRRLAWTVALVASGCVTSNTQHCPETGIVCPAGYRCGTWPDGDPRCIEPGQLAQCDGKAEGATCEHDGIVGSCIGGACEPLMCGDRIISPELTEQCEPAIPHDLACGHFGFYGDGTVACVGCQFQPRCSGGHCGDGIVNGPELCDGVSTKSCTSLGFDAGSLSCNEACAFQIRDCTKFGWDPEPLDIIALDVAASSVDDQWAVGLEGRAMRFFEGFWHDAPTGVPHDLKAVWAKAPHAWAVGLPEDTVPGVVLYRDDTAAQPAWVQIPNPPVATFNDVWAHDPMAVFVATKELGVRKYDGTSWSAVGNLDSEVFELHGTTPTDLWAATEAGLQHWNGVSWTPANLADTRIRYIDANAADDVWVAGEARSDIGTGVIAHWNGAAWRTWRTPQTVYNGLAATAPNDAWIVIAGGTLQHFDGVGWTTATTIGERPDGTSAISGIHAIDANHVVAVSTLRIGYRYRGMTFGKHPEMRLHSQSNPWSSAVNRGMWSPASNSIYVVDGAGQVVHYDGIRWTVVFQIPGASTPNAIWGSGPDAIFVAAHDGNVYRWNGATWIVHPLSAGVPLDELWGTSATNVWAFGAGGAFHWNGATWTRSLLSSRRVLDASGSAGEVYAIEQSEPTNKLWRHRAGAWRVVDDLGALTSLRAVVAVDGTNVHVAADGGHLFRYDGTSWHEQVVPASAELLHLAASGPRDVVAASERELFTFDGVQWSPMRTPIELVPNAPDFFPIAGLAVSPARVDILFERWVVRALLRTRPIVCEPIEICGDALDNDCNGRIDASDTCS